MSNTSWTGPNEEDRWSVEIGHDCFDTNEPFVVYIDTKDSFATPTADQAREMAKELNHYADLADQENERVKHADDPISGYTDRMRDLTDSVAGHNARIHKKNKAD